MGQFDQEIEESMGEVQRGMEPISPAEVPQPKGQQGNQSVESFFTDYEGLYQRAGVGGELGGDASYAIADQQAAMEAAQAGVPWEEMERYIMEQDYSNDYVWGGPNDRDWETIPHNQ